MRGRRRIYLARAGRLLFQSTPPCGGDARGIETSCLSTNFNPRPLAGATDVAIDVVVFNGISIHAPLRGRQRPMAIGRSTRRFQSTPPCGGDFFPGCVETSNPDFNPRPLAGATLSLKMPPTFWPISIHAPLRGRLWPERTPPLPEEFQSTPPCGGDS